ncbi:MAG: hypothetical protein ACD_33C00026G0002 [uncultured bacterium]|nr:MAG: hypothetical protein ACD_33C00026G0002 [uncultured bacterium]
MLAFRNVGGTVVEIEVDVDGNGAALLPPDTTVDAKPAADAGHYVTVVGNAWVQIPIPEEVISFEYKKQLALQKLSKYKEWYLNQPVTFNGHSFDADETSKNRLIQAVTINTLTTYLPPAWIDADNQAYALTTVADLVAIIAAIATEFSTKFFELNATRDSILAAIDDAALALVVIPEIPNSFS